jgi:hypothetical protein
MFLVEIWWHMSRSLAQIVGGWAGLLEYITTSPLTPILRGGTKANEELATYFPERRGLYGGSTWAAIVSLLRSLGGPDMTDGEVCVSLANLMNLFASCPVSSGLW